MRDVEFALLIACSVILIISVLKSTSYIRRLTLLVLTSIIALHLIKEGYRWQMIPGYIFALILILCTYRDYIFIKGNYLRKIVMSLGFIMLVFTAWTLPIILPIFELPVPTGKFKVGSQYLHLKTKEAEIITPKPNDTRELMIKVWYPAAPNNEATEPYLNDGDRISFATKYGLPKSTFNYLDAVKTHTYESPAVTNGKFPILIFSHGLYSKASGYYALLESIASHGYIILNINHTYESTGTLFPNGAVKLFHKAYDELHNNQAMADMIWEALEAYENAQTSEEKLTSIEYLIKNYMASEITQRWSNDISLVIDTIEQWNTTSFLAQHLDTNKIGVFGHSQGGAAAGQALFEDSRIKAGINIDGVQWGTMVDTILTKPFALISADWDSNHPDFNKYIFLNRSNSDFYNAKILRSGHPNFMDIPLMINFSLINECGPIDPLKGHKITNQMVIDFFDKYLLNKSNNLMEIKNIYPEFEIKLLHK